MPFGQKKWPLVFTELFSTPLAGLLPNARMGTKRLVLFRPRSLLLSFQPYFALCHLLIGTTSPPRFNWKNCLSRTSNFRVKFLIETQMAAIDARDQRYENCCSWNNTTLDIQIEMSFDKLENYPPINCNVAILFSRYIKIELWRIRKFIVSWISISLKYIVLPI